MGAGCGGEPPSREWRASSAAQAGASLYGDMVAPLEPGGGDGVRGSLTSTGGSGSPGEPKLVYLWYADGGRMSETGVNACASGTPPRFVCKFAPSLAECQKGIQEYLDRWYLDFNVVFTLARPTRGSFYTAVISSGGGAWCGAGEKVAGLSPFYCEGHQGAIADTFLGGSDAKATAIITAHELGHLIGLEHTAGDGDLMDPKICSDCDGFQDEKLATIDDGCDRATQNSHQMLEERLGLWPGGRKPSAFGCTGDAPDPALSIMQPFDGQAVNRDFMLEVRAFADCRLARIDVSVAPLGLRATRTEPPFEWSLTNITGEQTVTVTATDLRGHVSVQAVSVTAPVMHAGEPGSAPEDTGGCAVAAGTPPATALVPVLALLSLYARRRRTRQ